MKSPECCGSNCMWKRKKMRKERQGGFCKNSRARSCVTPSSPRHRRRHPVRGNTTKSTILCIVYCNLFRNPNFKYGPWSETITFGQAIIRSTDRIDEAQHHKEFLCTCSNYQDRLNSDSLNRTLLIFG